VQGYAEGATFTGSLLKGGYFLTRSFLSGAQREGRLPAEAESHM
jgi:hypothetical protein